MSDTLRLLLTWGVAVTAVLIIALLQLALKQGHRFTTRMLMAFTVLIAIVLELVINIFR